MTRETPKMKSVAQILMIVFKRLAYRIHFEAGI